MIRPVDMQMLIPTTQSAGNIQQHESQRPMEQNMVAVEQVSKEVKQHSEMVISKDTVEIHDYNYDAKEKGNNEYHGNGGKHRQKDEKKEDISNQKEPVDRPRVNFDIQV